MSAPRKTFNAKTTPAAPDRPAPRKYAPAWPKTETARQHGQALIKQLRKQFPDVQDAFWLLRNGAALDETSALNGDTPLHGALRNGFDDMIVEMIKRGAPLDVQTKMGQTPLDMAARKSKVEIVSLMLDAGAAPTENALVQAIAGRRMDNIARLIEAGVEVRGYMLDFVPRETDAKLHDVLADALARQKAAVVENAVVTSRDVPVRRPLHLKPGGKPPKSAP
jgi:hypothetical protein